MEKLIINMFLALCLYILGVFTFKGAVLFYMIEFIFYMLFFCGRYEIDDEDFDLDEIENEEFREEIRRYREEKGKK